MVAEQRALLRHFRPRADEQRARFFRRGDRTGRGIGRNAHRAFELGRLRRHRLLLHLRTRDFFLLRLLVDNADDRLRGRLRHRGARRRLARRFGDRIRPCLTHDFCRRTLTRRGCDRLFARRTDHRRRRGERFARCLHHAARCFLHRRRDARLVGIDPRRHHAHAHFAFHRIRERRTENDIRFRVHLVADAVHRFVHLEQRQIRPAGDVHQHRARAFERHIVEQRVADRRFRRLQRAAVAGCFAGAHHRLAHFAHHRADIREVEVDETRFHDQIRHPAHAAMQHFIREAERFRPAGFLVRDAEQILVRHHDQRVDILLQFANPRFRQTHAVRPLERERLRHHADRQNPLLFRDARDHRRRTRTRAAAHARRDEQHVAAMDRIRNLIRRFFRSRKTNRRFRPGTEAARDGHTQLDHPVRLRALERLRIRVRDDEIDTLEVRRNHVVDRVAARAADADHRDFRAQRIDMGWKVQIDGHSSSDCRVTSGSMAF